jgi:hypothetical protein
VNELANSANDKNSFFIFLFLKRRDMLSISQAHKRRARGAESEQEGIS